MNDKTFCSPTSSHAVFEICLSLMSQEYGIDFIHVRVLWQMNVLQKTCTANREEVCPANLLERPQQTFQMYNLLCFLMGYEEKVASYHHYFNITGSVACTGTAEIVAEPNFMNEDVASFKETDECF